MSSLTRIKFIFYILMLTNFNAALAQDSSFKTMLKLLLSDSTPSISIAKAALAKDDYLFLDAREYAEFEISHIEKARFVGYKSFTLNILKDVPKNKFIIVYCSIGKRSENIVLKLKKSGYQNVYNLYGGIFEWVNQGHLVYDSEAVTQNVHGYSPFWGRYLKKGIKVYK